MKQHEFLVEAFNLVRDLNVFPGTTAKDWIVDLLYLHNNGLLYGAIDENDKLKLVTCLYRLKEIPQKPPETYPNESKGNILYVAWVASRDNDPLALKRIVKSFLDANKDIKAICFHDLKKNEELKVFKRKKTAKIGKGAKNGKLKKAKSATSTRDTQISRGSSS